MKKFLICFFVLFSIIFVYPPKVSASDEVSLSKFNIETTIKENGSINMVELITYNFKGKYNGSYRDISIKNTDGISNIKVLLVSKNGLEVPFREVNNAKNGDNNVFQILKQGTNLYRIKIYSPSNDEKKTFKIYYTMKNVAIKYNDVGEFFYEYWSSYNETEIDNLKIHIDIPDNTENKNIKAYYHANSDGNISVKNGNVEYTFSHVNSKELVEARVLFPASLISLSPKSKNENALSRISNEETEYSRKKQQRVEFASIMKKIFDFINIILGLLFLVSGFVIWKKFKNSSLNDYSIYFPPELPEECTPAVAAYMVNGTVDGRTTYATILDLWRRGYLTIEKVESENKKDKVDFSIKKVKKATQELLKHERYFINWLFDILGDGESVTTSSIKESSKESSFYSDFQKWLKLIKKEVKSRGYYDKKANTLGKWIVVISIISIIISIISFAFEAYSGIFNLFLSILILISGIRYCIKRSSYGQSQYNNWTKFKDYIKNTNFAYNINTDYIESYIPYAEALDMKQNIMVKLRSSFYNPSQNMGWIYYYLLFDSINLNRKEQFNYYVYNSFGTGSSGSSSTTSGGYTSGSSGGGGAGGF
ncbi:DUF2207 family protein [Clostridium sp. LBM24168]